MLKKYAYLLYVVFSYIFHIASKFDTDPQGTYCCLEYRIKYILIVVQTYLFMRTI